MGSASEREAARVGASFRNRKVRINPSRSRLQQLVEQLPSGTVDWQLLGVPKGAAVPAVQLRHDNLDKLPSKRRAGRAV
jgi:hypothetical protein